MKYVFAAERKVVFFINARGTRYVVEFSDRNREGGSSYFTNDAAVARAIRKTSLYKRGAIVQVEGPTEEEEEAARRLMAPKRQPIAEVWQGKPKQKRNAARNNAPETTAPAEKPGEKVMEFQNITFAREAISKELGIPKSKLRTQAALDKAARDNGIVIKYVTA